MSRIGELTSHDPRTEELMQTLSPLRTCSLPDFPADMVGIVVLTTIPRIILTLHMGTAVN